MTLFFMHEETIRRHRLRKGLSQEQMAELLAISQNAYHKIENEQVKLKVETLEKIANVFEIDPSELLSESSGKYQIRQTSNDSSQGVIIQEHNFEQERLVWQQLEQSLRETIETQKLLIEALRGSQPS